MVARVVGFEPTYCQSQSLMPYRLATPEFLPLNITKLVTVFAILFLLFHPILFSSRRIIFEELSADRNHHHHLPRSKMFYLQTKSHVRLNNHIVKFPSIDHLEMRVHKKVFALDVHQILEHTTSHQRHLPSVPCAFALFMIK